MDNYVLSSIMSIVSNMEFCPSTTWVPPALIKSREDFVADPFSYDKIFIYATDWFRFWDPWCGSKDTTKFNPDWIQNHGWGFLWNMGLTKYKMWSTCIRFEEVMICWALFIAHLKNIPTETSSDIEKSIGFGKCFKIMEHLRYCIETWRNLEESLLYLSEFDFSTIDAWKNICHAMCHFLLLKNEKSIRSVSLLSRIIEELPAITLDDMNKMSDDSMLKETNLLLRQLKIIIVVLREQMCIHVLKLKYDISLNDENDIAAATYFIEEAAKKNKELRLFIYGKMTASFLKFIQTKDDIDERIEYISLLKKRLHLTVSDKTIDNTSFEIAVNVPKLNISFPNFLRNEKATDDKRESEVS
jgi:hypothetical protein